LQNNGYYSGKFTSIDMREVALKHHGIVGPEIHVFSLANISKQLIKEDIKGDIDYDIFRKNDWTTDEEIEIKKYYYQL